MKTIEEMNRYIIISSSLSGYIDLDSTVERAEKMAAKTGERVYIYELKKVFEPSTTVAIKDVEWSADQDI